MNDNSHQFQPDSEKFLSETALAFISSSIHDRVYEYIGECIGRLNPGATVFINSLHPEAGFSRIEATIVPGKMLDTIIGLLGFDPRGRTFKYDDRWPGLQPGIINQYQHGIFEMCSKTFPREAALQIEEALNTGEKYGVAFVAEEKMYAFASLLIPRGMTLQYRETLETFVRQASVTLKRIRAEEKEDQYHSLFNQMTEAVFYLDASGKILDVNEAALNIFDLDRKSLSEIEPIYKKLRLFDESMNPVDLEKFAPFEALRTGKTVKGQVSGIYDERLRDHRWLQINAIPGELKDNNSPGKVFVTMHDITRGVNVMKKLRETEERLEFALKAVNDVIWDWTLPDGKVYFDPRFYSMAGYPENTGCNDMVAWLERIHPDDRERCRTSLYQLTDGTMDTIREQIRCLHKNGSWIWILLRGHTVIKDLSGQATRITGVITDITNHVKQEAIVKSQLSLFQLADSVTLSEWLTATIDEAEKLSDSSDGFLHFVNSDQNSLSLQAWSTNTKSRGHAFTHENFYHPVKLSETLLDCLRTKSPVVHNDYDQPEHFWEFPEGYIRVMRELAVPVIRGENVVAILGVGNKNTDYDHRDVELTSLLADLMFAIVENKHGREELEKSKAEAQALTAALPDLMFRLDKNCVFLDYKAAPEELYYRRENIIGKRNSDISPPGFATLIEEKVSQTLSTGQMQVFEYQLDLPEKGVQDFEARMVPSGEDEVVTVVRNITGQKSYQQKLIELIATKDKLFSILAHDLRNPFNNIIGFSDLLIQEASSSDISDIINFAGLINRSARQTLILLDNLLHWARLQQGLLPVNPKPLILSEICMNMVRFSEGNAKLKEIDLKCHVPAHTIVSADEQMLNIILRNLISNAIKFTDSRGKVEIDSVEAGSEIIVTVSDTGIGIHEENIPRLFSIGSGFTMRGTKNEKGTGLGLGLCREFVERLQGRIWVESSPGKGSRFRFTLPSIQR